MSTSRETIIEICKKYIGKPYVWGGESMAEGGYDCSGYVYNVLKDAGFQVTRMTANDYRKLGKKISIGQQKKGDLLFFGKNGRATHVAIYEGNGKMYESIGTSSNTKSNPGKGVTLSNVSRRSDLMEVRTLFAAAGQTTDNVNKVTGYEKTQFIMDVQAATGSKVDGIAGNETIGNTVTVSRTKNKYHAVVTPLERRLKILGYYTGSIEADEGKTPCFGKGMETAVLAYQKDHGCVTDGEITARNRTWKSLLGMI